MAEDRDVELEVRSKHSMCRSFVRFINNTDRKVDVIWINFEGQHVKYKTLPPSSFFNADTFATHPWVFIDSETQDRLVVNCAEVFIAEPRQGRTHVYITIPLYTLRERALQVVRNALSQPEDAFKLELPITLQRELATMLKVSMKSRRISTC